MNKLLLCDLNNLLIRGMSKLPYLSHKGIFTSGIYGLLMQMARYVLVHEPDCVIVCNDSPPYKRKDIFPEYKRRPDRVLTQEGELFMATLSLSREICFDALEHLNIPVYSQKGYEADDIMAKIIQDKHSQFKKIIIVSNDSDLYQLLQYKNVFIDKGKTGMYSYNQFKSDFGIEPKDWVDILSIAGSHNAVPPVKKGIGQKTALKIFNDKNKLTELSRMFESEIQLRKRLAILPFDNFKLSYDLPQKIYNSKAFSSWLYRKYGIESSLNLEKMYKILLHNL